MSPRGLASDESPGLKAESPALAHRKNVTTERHVIADRVWQVSRFHLLEPTNRTFGQPIVWSHPASVAKYMFARNDKETVCVNPAKGMRPVLSAA